MAASTLQAGTWYGDVGTAGLERQKPVTVQTTDATVTNLETIEIPDEHAGYVEAIVAARFGADQAVYNVIGRVSRQGGGAVVTAVNVITPSESAGAAALACTWAASGNNAVLQVTGIAATTIRWKGRVRAEIFS